MNPDKVKDLINQAQKHMHSLPEKSLEFASQALEISEEIEFVPGKAMAIMNIGLSFLFLHKINPALEKLHQALAIMQEIKWEGGESQALLNIGFAHCRIHNYEKGLEYYLKQLAIDEKINNKTGLAHSYNNIANIYTKVGDHKQAEKYLFRSLQIAEEIDLDSSKANTYSNLGRFYFKKNEYDKALQYFQLAIEVSSKINNLIVLMKTHNSMAEIYRAQNDLQRSNKHFHKAYDFAQKCHDENFENQLLIDIAYNKYKENEIDTALQILLDLQAGFAQKNEVLQNSRFHNYLHIIYKEKGEFQKALQHLSEFHKIDKENIKKGFTDKISQLKTKFDFATKEKELELTKKQNELLQEKVEESIRKWKEQHQLLIQKSKLESLGKISAGIAHEINQPLQGISLGLENIATKIKMNKLTNEYMSKKIDNFNENITRIKKIIEHIRIFSREQTSLEIDIFEVNAMIAAALNVVSLQFRKHDITLDVKTSAQKLLTCGNKYKLEQVIFNLLSNSRDAVENNSHEKGKKISLKTKRNQNQIEITVRDNGKGISPQIIDNIFNPFFTTKTPDKGTGLGLSIAYGIIKDMNGEIGFVSSENEFTEVKISLPIVEKKNKEMLGGIR